MSWYAERFIEDAKRHRLDCAECGRPMWFPKSKLGKYTTCGGECAAVRYSKMTKTRDAIAAAAARRLEPRQPRPKRPSIVRESRLRNCVQCTGVFTVKKSQIDAGVGRFCSHRCAHDHGVHAKLFSHEIQQRAIANRRASIAVNGTAHKSGPEHCSWKGGPEASRERNRERARESCRRYRRENPEWAREQARKRQGRRTGRLPRGTVKFLGQAQRWKCAVCRTDIAKKYHVDHIEPLARGGHHVKTNIQLLCPPCNVRKSAKDPIAFMQSRGFLL